MPFAIHETARIYFEELGAGRRPAIALIHGGNCDHTAMADLAVLLAARQRVVNLDLGGHGLSGRPSAGFSPASLGGDVRAVITMRFSAPVVVVGHSMGGRVALELSHRWPGLVRALVLLDTHIVEEPGYVAWRRASFEADDWRSFLRDRADKMFLPGDHSVRRGQIIARMLEVSREVSIAVLEASDRIDTVRALRDCAVPVLYIAGTRPRVDQEELMELRHDLVWSQVVGAGHFVQIDAAPQVSSMIERFLDAYVL